MFLLIGVLLTILSGYFYWTKPEENSIENMLQILFALLALCFIYYDWQIRKVSIPQPEKVTKIIYLGFPMVGWENEKYGFVLDGFWSFIPEILPIDLLGGKGGWTFTVYEGSYFSALKKYLFGE